MRPVVELQLVENESKDKIYAEENKVLTLRLVNSRPWNEEKQLENYKDYWQWIKQSLCC